MKRKVTMEYEYSSEFDTAPYEAILDLLENNIDQFIEDDEREAQKKKQMASECRAEDIAVDEMKCRRHDG